MITERDLRQTAARNGIGAGRAEHEYAQLCVLDTLGQIPLLSDAFCFKGGTALRLVYFDDWRHSVDLDFSALPVFPADDLQPLVEGWFATANAAHGMEEPRAQHFLVPQHLAQAESYWERDLTGQVAGASLPPWSQITEDLALLLQGFVHQ